jgi:gamma-glutamyltranspeptidase/glutathione hydrolase
MALHDKFGRVPFDVVLSAAIEHADGGFPVPEITALEWAGAVPLLRTDTNAIRTYLPDGEAPVTGELFRNSDLARTLTAIARTGGDAFYRGDVAQRILQCSAEQGGAHTAADLAEYQPEWVTPLTTNYRGWDVYEIPPNSQGIAALVMLNILENFPLSDYGRGTAESLHVMIEAKKLAYADMQRHVGDPRFSGIPVEELLSKPYARERAGLIDPRRAKVSVDAGSYPRMPATRRIYVPSTARATLRRSFKATSRRSDRPSSLKARDSCSRIAAACSTSTVRIPTHLRRGNVRCRPSFPPS